MVKKVKRLYSEFQPENYTLKLDPDRDTMRFSGSVIINGRKVGRPSKRITLHQKNLKIKKASVVFHDKKTGERVIELERFNLHAKFDELRLHAAEILYPGAYTLTIEFEGRINEQMHGVYPCNFELNGKPQKLIATQFESHYAREVFPCIDEPEAKATFDLTLITPAAEEVIANTPAIKTTKKNGKKTTVFETTPKMSTYLLAFAYGNLKYKEAKTKHGVTVRTYATPDNVKFTEFALDVAVKCLDFYNEYFDIPYPLPKLDMIALPDFASGAMENWGLVTYREAAMLVDPKNTSVDAKQYVAMVVAHELAHQWFGNLVTMRWWTDLWLNEGFASWIEYLAVDEFFPSWHMWTQFIVSEQTTALHQDALANTHPVEVPINHPDEIRTIFDAISYQKGASVIFMLHGYLGAEAFRDGLRHYLKKHKYANSVTEDLWQALEEVSGKPVKEFMHAWTSQPGFPLINVATDKGELSLTQHRFYSLKKSSEGHELWPVPLNCESLSSETLDGGRAKIDWPGDAPLVNQGHSGFYATVYDTNAYEVFGAAIENRSMNEVDRLGLLEDCASAAKAGYLPITQALALLRHFENEDSSPVWDTIASLLADIRRVFDEDKIIESIRPYVREITAQQVMRLGWEEKVKEPYFDTLLRRTVLGMASTGHDEAVVKEALKRFNAMKRPEDEHPDLRSVVYHTASREGGKKEYEKMLGFYKSTQSAEEKVTLASALTNFKQPELYEKALGLVKTDLVRAQDLSYWVAYSFYNRHAKKYAWQWLKENWQWLKKQVGEDLSFSRMPIYAARAFASEEFKDEFIKFFEPLLEPSIQREYKQALEIIEWQKDWRQRDEFAIREFFSAD